MGEGGVLRLSLTRFLQCLVPSLVPFLWDFSFFLSFGSFLFWFFRSRVLPLLLSYSCFSARLGMKSEERVGCEGGVYEGMGLDRGSEGRYQV